MANVFCDSGGAFRSLFGNHPLILGLEISGFVKHHKLGAQSSKKSELLLGRHDLRKGYNGVV